MQLELLLKNDRYAMSVVGAMLHKALEQLALEAVVVEELKELVLRAVGEAVAHAYPAGEEGSIKLTIREADGKLEILIRDYGMPQDVESLQRRLCESGTSKSLFGSSSTNVADQMHWQGYGPNGKELQIVKWLGATHVGLSAKVGDAAPRGLATAEAPEQEYTIRRMSPDEATEVSQLMYRAYGSTYFNEDVYYPQRLAAQNAHNAVLSFIAVGEDRCIAGHYALELNQQGPVAECGQAVVHPAHRGRGLLGRMKDAAIQKAQRLELVGWFADAVCVHTRTQQSNVTHGGQLSGVDLAIGPRSERFRKIADEQPQRVTCLLYFHWLHQPARRTVFVPTRHQAVVSKIYENLQCEIRFGEDTPPTGHGRLAISMDSRAARAFVRADELGADSVWSIRHAKRELVERSHAEIVFVELPLENPATPHVVTSLEADGFAFAGVAPHFSTNGDMLRLIYLVEPLAREPIKTLEEFADYLVDYALSEQTRVREKL